MSKAMAPTCVAVLCATVGCQPPSPNHPSATPQEHCNCELEPTTPSADGFRLESQKRVHHSQTPPSLIRTASYARSATLGPAPFTEQRPPRVGKRDIRLRNARLDNALRLLAQAGDFHLILEGEMSQQLTTVLTDVEPYEALLALAEVHRLRVRYKNRIVTVLR